MVNRDLHEKDYTVISNHVILDKRLSAEARFLMVYLLSCKEDWSFTREGIMKTTGESRRCIDNSIKELIEYGYLTRIQTRNHGFSKMQYNIYETPMEIEENVMEETVLVQNVPSQNVPTKCEPQINTNIISTNITNTNIISTNNISSTKSKNYDDDVNFVGFWEMYPRKVCKSEAFKAWNKCIKTTSVDDIANGLSKWINYWKSKRTDVQYIPHPATWLNGKNWEAFPETKSFEDILDDIFNEGDIFK